MSGNKDIKSVVINKAPKYSMIIVTDGVLHGNAQIKEELGQKGVSLLVSKKAKATVDDTFEIIRKYIDDETLLLSPAVVLSTGNHYTSRWGYFLEHPVAMGRERELENKVADLVMEKIVKIEQFIKDRGGILMVAPLIPRPADQCYENCKGIPGRMQQLYSNLHLKVNDLISELNEKKNGLQTPPINSYL